MIYDIKTDATVGNVLMLKVSMILTFSGTAILPVFGCTQNGDLSKCCVEHKHSSFSKNATLFVSDS